MSDNTKIEWCDATWNPLYGCTRVSEGCRHCYAEGLAARFHKHGQWGEGLTRDGKWTGKVTLAEAKLTQPLRWRKPRRIFVNSLSDLFHPGVSDDQIDSVFDIMALAHWHTFIVLTKRAARMRQFLSRPEFGREVTVFPVPLPNVWLGVSAENQQAADERIPDLLATPAAVRIVSAEPLLGPVDLTRIKTAIGGNAAEIDALTGDVWYPGNCGESSQTFRADLPRIDGVIVGGESGPKARPMDGDWARSLRDQCAAVGVPFHFKQHGEWIDVRDLRNLPGGSQPGFGAYDHCAHDRDTESVRVGKSRAGRHLDGKIHDALPLAKDTAE